MFLNNTVPVVVAKTSGADDSRNKVVCTLNDGVMFRGSALHSVHMGFIFSSRVIPKDLKKWYSQLSCLALSKKGIVWRTSWQACWLCPWARHLTGCLYFYVATAGRIKQSIRQYDERRANRA